MRAHLTSMAIVFALVAHFAAQTVPVQSAAVAGRVVDTAGRPLAGVTVSLGRTSAEQLHVAKTDASGAYRFNAVADGTYSVAFQTPIVYTTRTGADRLGIDVVLVRVETTFGNIDIAVDLKRAPNTSANFLKYVDAGLYDGGRFHRATRPDNYKPAPPNRPAMELIQGGINPEKKGQGFPAIPLERTSVTGLKHVRGVVSMARGGPDTATSDFFILLDDQPSLDFGGLRFDDAQGAAAFGTVVAGLDVVEKIQQQPVTGQNLTPPVAILSVKRLLK